MTRHGSHTESRMRENCTYGSMRGRTYPAGASRPTLHPLRSPMNVLMVSRRRMNAREACRRKMSAICTSPNRMSVMGVLPGVIRGGVRSGLTVVSCLINVILIVPRISRNKRRI